MIVYLAEYDPDSNEYEPTPLVTVGIYTTRELAEAAVKVEIEKDVWYYGRPEVIISEWELDKAVEKHKP